MSVRFATVALSSSVAWARLEKSLLYYDQVVGSLAALSRCLLAHSEV